VFQDIVDTGYFDWPGRGCLPAALWAGGDSPWSRRWVGVSVCPQVGSIHNEAVRVKGVGWVGAEIRRTLERQAEHHAAYLKGKRSLQVAGCVSRPLIRMDHKHVVECILHASMGIGRQTADWLQGEAAPLPPAQRAAVQQVLHAHKTGLCLRGKTSLDGEETFRLLGAWEDIDAILKVPGDISEAIRDMRWLLKNLYRTYQTAHPPNCRQAATAFREAINPRGPVAQNMSRR